MYQPLVSIVIPTYNEQEDIAATLDALVGLSYAAKEILVVDDSQDGTPCIVRGYAQSGVRLLEQGAVKGRSAARNQGILEARGEVVIVLNADVALPQDFCERILVHYQRGADYVLVGEEVSNTESLYPRYVGARAHRRFDGQDWINWTEGFSCRRAAAIDVGLFPADTPIPICAGEDGVFGTKLEIKYNKVIDRSIVVTHTVPSTLCAFWGQRLGRGKGGPQIHFFIQGKSLTHLVLTLGVRTAATVAKLVLAVPFWRAWGLIAYSSRGVRDVLPFAWAGLVDGLAGWVGHLQAVVEIRDLCRGAHA